MAAHKLGFQYFFYKPHVWMMGLTLLGACSYMNLQLQQSQQGKRFVDARPSVETVAFEEKFSLRPGEQKDALFQIDFSPISHSGWAKRD